MQQNPPSDKPEMRMEMRMQPVAINEQGLGHATRATDIGNTPVEPLTQSEFEHPNGLGHDPENPPTYDWSDNGALPTAEEPMEELMPTHWSLVHAPIIAAAMAQLNDIENIDVRTWLGNLYLVYQQQCGNVAIDWAMAFTDVELLDEPAGAVFALSHINRDYDIRLLETHEGYYVTKAEPQEQDYTPDDMQRILLVRLDTHEVVSPMFGVEHARNMGNNLNAMFTEAVHQYFQFGEEGNQVNPLVDAVRTILMYLVEQGYTTESEFTADDFNVDEGDIRLVHREWPIAVDIHFNLSAIKSQYANMLRQVKRESEANMAGLINLAEPESQAGEPDQQDEQ